VSDASPSLVGKRGNPHPSQGGKYEIEVIDQGEGEVCVRYVHSDEVSPWWITEQAWHEWKKAESNA
jgi:hypothetical protein